MPVMNMRARGKPDIPLRIGGDGMHPVPVDLLQAVREGNRVKGIIRKIVIAEPSVGRGPYTPMLIQAKAVDNIVGERPWISGFVTVDNKIFSIKTVEPVRRAQPDESIRIFEDFLHGRGQTVIRVDVFKGNRLLLCIQVKRKGDAHATSSNPPFNAFRQSVNHELQLFLIFQYSGFKQDGPSLTLSVGSGERNDLLPASFLVRKTHAHSENGTFTRINQAW